MKIRIYRQTEQDFDRIEIEGATFETIVSRAAVEGLQCSGYDSNPSQRPELQGAPKFKGVCGPMWDGDAIRYECSATYAELSKSEEHTSELQSLMRISYAVICLKKKNYKRKNSSQSMLSIQ